MENNNISYPQKYSINTVVDAVAKKHNLSKKVAKDIYSDIFDIIQYGVLEGHRVPIGDLGKMLIKIKPATKERQGRNPFNGEVITIKAKPETKVPKLVFSKNFKETVSQS